MEIKKRFTGEVIHSGGLKTMRGLVLDALNKGVDLRGADLWGANLSGADLSDANLSDANLSGADLWGADLSGADLSDANLSGVNLWGANLWGANLRDANLSDANLSGVNLWGANLRGANLSDANLSGADLRGCAGNQSEIKSILISEVYSISYTSEYLQIGCKSRKIIDWWTFDNKEIAKMDGKKAVKFWNENKEFIKKTLESYPATKTRHEER